MKNRMKNRMLLLMGMIFMGGSAYGGGIRVITGEVMSVGEVFYVETYLSPAVFSTAMETPVGQKAILALVEFAQTPAGQNAMNTPAGKNTINAFFKLLATPTTQSQTEELGSEVSDVEAVVGNRSFGLR